MKTTSKVFLACGLGAFIGTLVALQMHRYLWWVGMLIGGLAGIVLYDPKALVIAVSMAYKKTKKEIQSESAREISGLITLLLISITNTFLLPLIMVGGLGYESDNARGILSIIGVVFFFVTCLMIAKETKNGSLGPWDTLKASIGKINPFSFHLYFLPLYLIKIGAYLLKKMNTCLSWAFRGVPVAINFGIKFLRNLFVAIYSEVRLLCGICAALGTVIGYFSGDAITGLFAGGICGIINWEVVSKRILKVSEVKST